jgi:glycosyltransferase involved in cell wall biosynthesis|tara:strand:+ start:100 stop:792 length:693 start_codon:yes stop_codon:yes gene_type:complete
MKLNSINLIVVIPVFNEEKIISKVIEQILIGTEGIKKKIILINDGSKDKSLEEINKYKENEDIIVIDKPNEGHGPTLIRGYKEALKFNPKYIFQMDSDNQIEFSEFLKIYQLKDEYDLIIGKRFQRNDPYIRILISKILKLVIIAFHKVWIIDSNSPFRLMNNRFLRANINKSQNSIVPNIILSILAAKTRKIKFLKVNHKKRETGKPSIVKLKLFYFCIKSFRDIILLK